MNRALQVAAVALIVALAAQVEVEQLRAIANHPASGGDPSGKVFVMLMAWAGIPLLAAVALAVGLALSGRPIPLLAIAVALATGAGLSVMALAQYSHATPGFLALGFLVQCAILVGACLRSLRKAK